MRSAAESLAVASQPAQTRDGTVFATGWLLLAGAALLLGLHGLALHLQLAKSIGPNLLAILAESAVHLAIVWGVLSGRIRIPLPLLIGIAVLLRLAVLLPDPHHSTDVYRYVWDGRVQAAGINPYRYVPSDPALASLRDTAIWPLINRADYAPTIYPPAAEAFFWLATRLGETAVAMKAALLAAEAVALWCVVRLLDLDGLPRDRAVILAWSPLAAWEIAGSGHVDALMAALVVGAVLLARRRGGLAAGATLGLAVLVKFLPLALLPAFWRWWDWRLPAVVAGVVVAGYLPYLGAGAAVLGFLPGYAGEEGITSGTGFWLLRAARDVTGLAIPTAAYLALAAVALLTLALAVTTWPERERITRGALALAAAAVLALTPAYPWYCLWLLPLLCLRPSWPLLWLTGSAFLLYATDLRVHRWPLDVVYGGTLSALAATVAARSLRRRRIAPTRLST